MEENAPPSEAPMGVAREVEKRRRVPPANQTTPAALYTPLVNESEPKQAAAAAAAAAAVGWAARKADAHRRGRVLCLLAVGSCC